MLKDEELAYRRKRLSDLADGSDFQGRADFGRAIGFQSGANVRQMIDGERPITEKTIAKIEALRNGKYAGWFQPPPSNDEAELVAIFRRLPSNRRDVLLQDARALLPVTDRA